MRHSIQQAAVAALVGALMTWNCGGGGGPSTPTAPTAAAPVVPGAVTVSIVTSTGNQAFSPNPVRARAGDTVMFRNSDATAHHIVLDDGSADFGNVAAGATSRGVVLRDANPTTFHCTLHATMVGSINGLTAPDTPPCVPDIYGYGC